MNAEKVDPDLRILAYRKLMRTVSVKLSSIDYISNEMPTKIISEFFEV